VVTGAGRAFCAGADLEELKGANPDLDPAVFARARPRTRPLEFRKPLIAAINGAAAGLGLVEALYCDIRFAKPSAKLTTAFARRGLIAEYGMAWLLPRLVGPSRALDLLLSGRVVTAEAAVGWGLVDELAEDPLEAAVAYAQELATYSSQNSMAIIKGQVQRDLDRSFAEAVAEADQLMVKSLTGADVHEGVQSYFEKRPPAFPPLPPRS
jgi:enoyl-CoA hydratase/carnithine racemase